MTVPQMAYNRDNARKSNTRARVGGIGRWVTVAVYTPVDHTTELAGLGKVVRRW